MTVPQSFAAALAGAPLPEPRSGSLRPLANVVLQHVEEAAILREQRSTLVRAPQVTLALLGRLDERLVAHLDAIRVAGGYGYDRCIEALANPGVGETFVAAVCAIRGRDDAMLERLLGLAAAGPAAQRGLASAFGWVSPNRLRGIVRGLLMAPDGFHRAIGIEACDLHRADPGISLTAELSAAAPTPRAALSLVAHVGRVNALPLLEEMMSSADGAISIPAALAAALLGARGMAIDRLEAAATEDGADAERCLLVFLLAADFERGRTVVRRLVQATADDTASKRRLIQACAWLGDAQTLPWLADLAADDRWSRLAGESFATITGCDVTRGGLERPRPEAAVAAAAEAPPLDDSIEIDPDEGRPWADRQKMLAFLADQQGQLVGGRCCFMGDAPSLERCRRVLRDGRQPQRRLASLHLKLAEPSLALFNIHAPAMRQRATLSRL